ncbi:MAG: undecaprenyl/decaprenyl-phosphate alpha-N-acetylglucosaminyl 1-phosphate transferase [Acidobacteria bacterium]|nr:undecaprenyl/decaprenyl-phosphate alpha-N-acetylglucosaminyl 1-phosphate transferase [Acidobacteriota bacterium]
MYSSGEVKIYGVLFLLSFFLVLLFVPGSVRLAHKLRALDYPAERKIHLTPIPRLGGVAVFASIWLTLLLGYGVNIYIRAGMPTVTGLVAGSFLILFLGVYDDIRNASPFLKLPVQVVAAGVAVGLGIRFDLASNPLAQGMRDYFDLGSLAIPLSILWIVGLTNAMNLIDGLDGLATGIATFTSITLFLISMKQGAGIVTYFYVIIAGATLAFLKFNHYPARVFLGDSGSTSLGFLLACLSIRGGQKSYTLTALFIPLIVFGIPIFDAISALIRRYLAKAEIQEADSQHIHHQLLNAGLTQRQAVWILYAATILLGMIAFSFTALLDQYAAVIVIIIGLLGGFLGKELNVFGTQKRAMERGFRYLELRRIKEKDGVENDS